MISSDEIKEKIAEAKRKVAPIAAELKLAQDKYKKAYEEIQKPLDELVQRFFDERLLDKNGRSVQVGDIITMNRKVFYRVMSRGVIGDKDNHWTDRPCISCKEVINARITKKSSSCQLQPQHLKEYEIF